MKFLSRLLSLLLSFQLLWSCEATQHLNINDEVQDVVEIHGEIAKVFMKVSNLIIPSAMAQEKMEVAKKVEAAPVKSKALVIPEGLITVYDMSDPNDPVELYSENLVGSSYNIKMPRQAIENKIIKISYESYDSDDLSRDQIVEIKQPLKSIAQDLSKEETLKSRVAEEHLKIEINAERIKLEDSKQMLAKINSIFSIKDVMEAINNKDVMIQLLLYNKRIAQKVSQLAANYRIALNSGDKRTVQNSKDKIIRIAKDLGLLKDTNRYFESNNRMSKIEFSSYRDLKEVEAALTRAYDASWRDAVNLMREDRISEKDSVWKDTISLFKQDLARRLQSADSYFNGGAVKELPAVAR